MAVKKHWLWLLWSTLTIGMIGLMTYQMFGPDRRRMLPGPTSHGHYQIELDCNACHTPWMGVKEDACYNCHAAELKAANDSHPKSKFTDPRNADRLQLIKADNCVVCHREHLPEQTRAMGVTMPDDYCFHCHQQTLTDRPSHKNFAFDSCATAGCHNYHDNTALYEGFLVKHAGQLDLKDSWAVPARDLRATLLDSGVMKRREPLAAEQQNAPRAMSSPSPLNGVRGDIADGHTLATTTPNNTHPSPLIPLPVEWRGKPHSTSDQVLHDWATTAHAKAGVNCTDCHEAEDQATRTKRWSDKLDHTACASCHAEEVAGFLGGKHGMRLARGLTPMTPAQAHLPMKPDAVHRELSCTSCHGAHEFDTRRAAVDACLSCHNDAHSLAYVNSSHFKLWQAELNGTAPANSGVSCATCHLPRETHGSDENASVRVQHNQNANLRPNEKMIRSVCLSCHGLAFSLDALADAALVQNNFIGRPARHIESIDLALRRQMELQKNKLKEKGNR